MELFLVKKKYNCSSHYALPYLMKRLYELVQIYATTLHPGCFLCRDITANKHQAAVSTRRTIIYFMAHSKKPTAVRSALTLARRSSVTGLSGSRGLPTSRPASCTMTFVPCAMLKPVMYKRSYIAIDECTVSVHGTVHVTHISGNINTK